MNIIKKCKIIMSILLNLIGLKSLSKSIDPNLDIFREVESSIFTNHQKETPTKKEIKQEKKVS